MRVREIVAGQKFNALMTVKLSFKDGHQYWRCLCDCGNYIVVRYDSLYTGNTKSCGCWNFKPTRLKHGLCRTKEYNTYRNILARCYDRNNVGYPFYGGKGVKVCHRWLKGFEYFYLDMGNAPTKLHSIDRKNPGGNYTPFNCKWSTRVEQDRNKRHKSSGVYWDKIRDRWRAESLNKFGRRTYRDFNKKSEAISYAESIKSKEVVCVRG